MNGWQRLWVVSAVFSFLIGVLIVGDYSDMRPTVAVTGQMDNNQCHWEFARIYPEKARRLGISFGPAPPLKMSRILWDSVTKDAQRAGVVEKAEAARRRGDMQALILANIELEQFDAGQVSVCRDVMRFWKSIDDNIDRLRDFALGWAAFFMVLYISIKWVARGFKRVNP